MTALATRSLFTEKNCFRACSHRKGEKSTSGESDPIASALLSFLFRAFSAERGPLHAETLIKLRGAERAVRLSG